LPWPRLLRCAPKRAVRNEIGDYSDVAAIGPPSLAKRGNHAANARLLTVFAMSWNGGHVGAYREPLAPDGLPLEL